LYSDKIVSQHFAGSSETMRWPKLGHHSKSPIEPAHTAADIFKPKERKGTLVTGGGHRDPERGIPMSLEHSKSTLAQCKATTASGHQCKAKPHKDGLCFFHSDPQRAAELGHKSAPCPAICAVVGKE
jgi:hypothetical protein